MDTPIFPGHPVGGIDYPRTMQEFDEWFPDEAACAAYLLRLRWPKGFICPSCGATKGWFTARRQIRCAGCQRQTSVTAGTIFEGTRKPLRMWFLAVWYESKVWWQCLGPAEDPRPWQLQNRMELAPQAASCDG